MTFSSETIDRIVANVMSQLGTPRQGAVVAPAPATNSAAIVSGEKFKAVSSVSNAIAETPKSNPVSNFVSLTDLVITGKHLETIAQGTTVQVPPKAILTPSAQDEIRGRKLQILKQVATPSVPKSESASATGTSEKLLIVVKNTPQLDQIAQELTGTWKREFTTCPDDAAKLATAELCRGGASEVLIIAPQTHRAACLANRNDKVKAVAIRDAGDVRLIRKQLRANVWCLDATGKTYFELKNLLRELQASSTK